LDTPPMPPPAPTTYKPNPIRKWIRTYFMERAVWRLPRTDRVLDLCCGYGFYFTINPHAQGVDGDPVCVAELCRKGYHVKQCDVTQRLPFDDGTFECVLAHDALEHFTLGQLEAMFPEVHRVLRPRGLFMIIVPNRKGYDFGLRIGAGHQLYVTAAEVAKLCKDLFTIERHSPEPLPRWIGKYFTYNKEVFELRKR
jgi:SAM-dependent methyltransferase